MLKLAKKVICTTKILLSGLRAVAANSFSPSNCSHFVINKALIMVYNLYLSFQSMKLTLILFIVRKNISRVTSMLILANKKVLSKKQDFSFLSSTKKEAIIITKLSNLLPLSF